MTLTAEQTKLQSAARTIAARFGVGVSSWTATSPATGLGGTAGSTASVTGYAVHGSFPPATVASSGALVGPIRWYFVLLTGTITPGAQISASGYTFEIVSEAAAGLGVYELKRVGVAK